MGELSSHRQLVLNKSMLTRTHIAHKSMAETLLPSLTEQYRLLCEWIQYLYFVKPHGTLIIDKFLVRYSLIPNIFRICVCVYSFLCVMMRLAGIINGRARTPYEHTKSHTYYNTDYPKIPLWNHLSYELIFCLFLFVWNRMYHPCVCVFCGILARSKCRHIYICTYVIQLTRDWADFYHFPIAEGINCSSQTNP